MSLRPILAMVPPLKVIHQGIAKTKKIASQVLNNFIWLGRKSGKSENKENSNNTSFVKIR